MPMEEKLVHRLESAVTRLEALSATGFRSGGPVGTGDGTTVLDPSIIAFDDLMSQFLGKVSSAAEKIGGHVLDITKIVEAAFSAQRELLIKIKETKILVEFKNKDPNHVEWAKALKELYLPGLRDYVKSHYPLGPVWSATGETAVSAPSKAPSPSAPAPPPPPSSLFSSESPQASSSRPTKGMSAVFDEINSGKPVTSGLRKVTDDMKTKNRADRTGVVNAGEKEARVSSPSVSKTGPPKLELQMGRKWVVENQVGEKNLVIDDCDTKQSVYVYGCKSSVLQIKGKVNNITIDKCTKMGVVFAGVVAACEIVNCNGVEVQCQGSAPTISIDNTNGCQLYLNKDSLEGSITTAKSSEINVLVPGDGPDDDWGEHALPQQYAHEYKDGRFVTTPVSHSGA
ncbi:cyclase-associated protein 1 isoform X2 [Solanum dulcamara]|uniref:cyclase-associated protein 1 isoform X2 n=1 Tax=Solanum dulcamara TaxID=45834 RepID=UPI00248564F0|nr:cyclase-associated protein 1 isoform X2 [Solanum dulcamara]